MLWRRREPRSEEETSTPCQHPWETRSLRSASLGTHRGHRAYPSPSPTTACDSTIISIKVLMERPPTWKNHRPAFPPARGGVGHPQPGVYLGTHLLPCGLTGPSCWPASPAPDQLKAERMCHSPHHRLQQPARALAPGRAGVGEASNVPSALPMSRAPEICTSPAPLIIAHLAIISGSWVKSKSSSADWMTTLRWALPSPQMGENKSPEEREKEGPQRPP